MRVRSFLPLAVVALLLAAALVVFPLKSTARDAVPWSALSSFFESDFLSGGFSIACVSGTSETCTVNWRSPADRGAPNIAVYSFADEQDLTRDAVLVRFEARARNVASQRDVLHALGVLDGFFQSGLRRMADRAMRRARDGRVEIFHLPPFRLSDAHRVSGKNVRFAEGIDASFTSISTGLPRRPSYRADILASSSFGGASPGAMGVRILGTTSSVLQILDPQSPRTCRQIAPGGVPDDLPCRAVTITPCARNDFACREPVLEIHALSAGLALVRSAGNPQSRLLSRGGQPLRVDDVLLVKAADAQQRLEPLQVDATAPMQPFRIEIRRGGDVAISRQRMVNGRWDRWYEPSVQPWMQPLVTRWEHLIDTRPAGVPKVNPQTTVRLSLDLSLHNALEERLAAWMRDDGREATVRAHLEKVHYGRSGRRLSLVSRESNHRRPVPHAGVTVLDAQTGNILAVASYPPAHALVMKDGVPSFAPGWRERLAGSGAPAWAVRDILEVLADRVNNDTNANFVTHPIGSTFKPLLLSLTIDAQPGDAPPDGVDRLFNLMVAGHLPRPTRGLAQTPYQCPGCTADDHEAVAGMPLGPYGNEEGSWQHKQDLWIDRAEFLIDSCNKYAVTLGVLSLLDATRPAEPNTTSCCWNVQRDSFAISPAQSPAGGSPAPYNIDIYSRPSQLPPLGPWLAGQTAATTARFAEAPIFARLEHYYGVPARTHADAYDALPWARCAGIDPLQHGAQLPRMGTVARTQLALTTQIVGPSFTNLFTGAGHNWWSSVKLAEAYARMATNKATSAVFCGGNSAQGTLFRDGGRHAELLQILSRQRQASWVRLNKVNAWISAAPDRVVLSKTGTTLRMAGYASTGVFGLYVGKGTEMLGAHPTKVGDGVVMVVYVDDVGRSEDVTRLTDALFELVRPRLER